MRRFFRLCNLIFCAYLFIHSREMKINKEQKASKFKFLRKKRPRLDSAMKAAVSTLGTWPRIKSEFKAMSTFLLWSATFIRSRSRADVFRIFFFWNVHSSCVKLFTTIFRIGQNYKCILNRLVNEHFRQVYEISGFSTKFVASVSIEHEFQKSAII